MNANEVLNSPSTRFLQLARRATKSFRSNGWRVREAAVHGAGMAEAVAVRAWKSPRLNTDVRMLAHCHLSSEAVVLSATDSAAEALSAFSFAEARSGDSTIGAKGRVAPSLSRNEASLFHTEDLMFGEIVDAAFESFEALIADLHEHEREVFEDDAETAEDAGLEKPLPQPHMTLIHPLVITTAPLWLLGENDRVTSKTSVRLLRTRAASGERAWIDVVHVDAIEKFIETVTRHYVNVMKKRRFVAL